MERLKGTTPLSLYIFSQSSKFIDWVRRNTTSGSVVVNDLMVQFTIDGLPFGGVGESGQGNYHGKRSFDVFTHERSSLSSPYWADPLLAVRYYPYSDKNIRSMKSLMVKKVNFARPGSSPGLLQEGGLLRRVFPFSVLAVLLAWLGKNWSWLVMLVPRYKITRTR